MRIILNLIVVVILAFGIVCCLDQLEKEKLSTCDFKNKITHQGTIYRLYGLEGKGYVKQAYEVFTPVYMAESTYEQLEDEQ